MSVQLNIKKNSFGLCVVRVDNVIIFLRAGFYLPVTEEWNDGLHSSIVVKK